MYIKREDIWRAGRKEERDKTDDKVLEFAAKLKVPLQQFLQQRSLQSHRYEKKVSLNQDQTKTRNKLAYEAHQFVKAGKVKSTFVWVGKTFVTSHNDRKHKILKPNDKNNLLVNLGAAS